MAKQQAQRNPEHSNQSGQYRPIEMPKNSPLGFINAFFAVVTGFALIWHIWWLAALGLIGAFMAFLVFAFRDEEEITVPIEQIAQFERRHHAESVAS
jgi:cytochrome o ubiquinol oxidase subunit 1